MTHEAVSSNIGIHGGVSGGTRSSLPDVEPPTLTEREKATQLLDAITKLREANDSLRLSQLTQLRDHAKVAIVEAYNAGFADGQAELRKQLPAVVRETSFISDDKGRIVGKTEREFTPGGKVT